MDNLVDLIQRELDGVTSPEEKARVRNRLVADPEAKALYDQLGSVVRMLSTERMAEPPPTLKPAILRAIRQTTKPQTSLRSLFAPVRDFLNPHPVVRYAFAFSGGIVVGLMILAVVSRSPEWSGRMPENVSGAMVLDTGTLKQGESVDMIGERVRARLSTGFSPQVDALTAVVSSSGEVTAVVAFDSTGLMVGGITGLQGSMGPVSIRPGRIELASQGEVSWTVIFQRTGSQNSPLRVSLFSSGGVVAERSLRVREGRERSSDQ